MTSSEIERLAYMAGNLALATYAALVDDYELDVDSFDEQLQAKFEAGKFEASDTDLLNEIDSLKAQLEEAVTTLNRARGLIDATTSWLNSDNCKTVQNRVVFAKSLSAERFRIR